MGVVEPQRSIVRLNPQLSVCYFKHAPPRLRCRTASTVGQYGSIELGLEHLPEEKTLSVTIHRCRGLTGVGRQGLSDPYVRLFLTPSSKKDEAFKTVVQRHSVDPEYNEEFVFKEVSATTLDEKCLVLVVLDRHDASKDQPIGAISVPLYEATPHKTDSIRKLLDDPDKIMNVLDKAEISKVEVSFCYKGQASILRVAINQAVVRLPPGKNYPNSYVAGHLQILTTSAKEKQRTHTVNRTAMPIFDDVLEFSKVSAQLCQYVLTLSVWDHRKISKDILLGKVTLRGRKFWEKVKSSNILDYEWYHLHDYIPRELSSTDLFA